MGFLIENGADIDNKNHSGYTILHKISVEGGLKSLKFLLDRGANINVVANDGSTRLHLAVRVKHFKMVQILLQYCSLS